MADHVSKNRRSQIMAAVRSKNTGPEYQVRKLLHRAGFRFRLHKKKLPGQPDIVLRKYSAIIFVNGCFWHGHSCILSKGLPKTSAAFWHDKIVKNQKRDLKIEGELLAAGWRVCVVWECALKRRHKLTNEKLESLLSQWLKGGTEKLQIIGYKPT